MICKTNLKLILDELYIMKLSEKVHLTEILYLNPSNLKAL